MDNILQYWAQNNALSITAKHYDNSDLFEKDIDLDRFKVGGACCRIFPEQFEVMNAKLDAVGGCVVYIGRGEIYTIREENNRIRDGVNYAGYFSGFDLARFIDYVTVKETFRIVDDTIYGIASQLEAMEKREDYVCDPYKFIPELIARLSDECSFYIDTLQTAYDKYLADKAIPA